MVPLVPSVRRSPFEWRLRVVLAIIVMIVGGFNAAFTLAQMMANANPAFAHRLAPYDARITAGLARRRLAEGLAQGSVDVTASERLARFALRSDPTTLQAVTTLGMKAQAHGNVALARHIFAYAQQLSRRDLGTNLWAVEDAVARGDISDALHKYDVALRTSKEAPDLLFPILGAAMREADVRIELVNTLARRPPWATSFMAFLSVAAGNPAVTARLLVDLHRRGLPVLAEAQAATTNRLMQSGAAADAWAFYAAMRPGVDRRRSRDPGFAAELAVPTVFDWVPVNDDIVSASVQRTNEGGVFGFSVPTSTAGGVLAQAQVLPPGTYQLTGINRGLDRALRALPYWQLTCANGRQLGRVALSASSRNDAKFAGNFSVPADCPVQTLALVVQASDEIAGVSGEIRRAALVPAS